MAVLAKSIVSHQDPRLASFSGCHLKPSQKPLTSPLNLSFGTIRQRKTVISVSKRQVSVQAAYRIRCAIIYLQFVIVAWILLSQQCFRDEGASSAGIFVGGFVFGGIIVGALGCVFAPQISKVLTGAERKDLMRRLPKFIYDEEKALEKTRKILTEKIEQLNSAIDDVSAQLRAGDDPNGAVVASDEIEASI